MWIKTNKKMQPTSEGKKNLLPSNKAKSLVLLTLKQFEKVNTHWSPFLYIFSKDQTN